MLKVIEHQPTRYQLTISNEVLEFTLEDIATNLACLPENEEYVEKVRKYIRSQLINR